MTREEYIAALVSHDWYYEYSEDQSVWKRGNRERSALDWARADLDPGYVLWNEYAPDMSKHKEAKHD